MAQEKEQDRDIIKECEKFLKESSTEFSTDMQRQTEQLEQFSGNFWTDGICKKYKRTNKNRPNLHFSNWEVMANAAISPLSDSPFHIALEKTDEDLNKETQEGIDNYEGDSDSKTNLLFSAKRAFICGNGFYVISVDRDELTGDNKICGEFVTRQDSVALDPSAMAVDGSDAEQGAIVNYLSLKKAKRLYGDGIVPMDYPDSLPTLDFTNITQWQNEEGKVQVVTYYRKKNITLEGGKKTTIVEWFKICGNGIVDRGTLPIKFIPIVRFAGYAVYKGGAVRYVGIVDKTFSLQLGINIAYSTMVERAGRSAKANYLAHVDAVNGLAEYYKKLNDDDSLVVLWKGDKEPRPLQESFVTSDLSEMIANTRNLLSDVVGIPLTGINGINETKKTATEVMQQQINSESNVANFYNNAYKACRTIGRIVVELLTNGQDLKFTLENGPAVITEEMKHRKELAAIAQLVPENMRPLLAIHYADSLKNEYAEKVKGDIIANLPNEVKLVSEQATDPAAIHELRRMQAVCEQLQAKNEQLEQQNEELQKQYESAELSILTNRENRAADMQKFMISERDKMNLETAKLQAANAEAAAKLSIENKKVNAELERTAAETEQTALETAERIGGDYGV